MESFVYQDFAVESDPGSETVNPIGEEAVEPKS